MKALPELRERPTWATAEDIIAQKFAGDAVAGLPIYVRLQNVITHLVNEQALPVNSQLPPDQRLTSLLGISLGTVQKALGNLAALGWVRREQGNGTFIAEPRQPLVGSWHLRFRDPATDERLPVYSKLLARRRIDGLPRLRRELGDDPAGYIEIERLFDVDGRFPCHGRLYLGAERFGRLMDYPRAALEDANLKNVFADEFAAPTLAVRERMRAIALDSEIAAHLGENTGAAGMQFEVVAFTTGGVALSFQEIIIPATNCPLDITPLRQGS